MLTAAQAATLLGLSARKVYDLHASGELAGFRFGRAVRFDPADVEAFRKATQKPDPRPLMSMRTLRTYERYRREAIKHGEEPALPPLDPDLQKLVDKRYRNLRAAPWADKNAIRALYDEARRLTQETGTPHEVDHVIPLLGNFVSGLHVETNLQVIPKVDNHKKLNRFEVE